MRLFAGEHYVVHRRALITANRHWHWKPQLHDNCFIFSIHPAIPSVEKVNAFFHFFNAEYTASCMETKCSRQIRFESTSASKQDRAPKTIGTGKTSDLLRKWLKIATNQLSRAER